jgi:hypothetical protein
MKHLHESRLRVSLDLGKALPPGTRDTVAPKFPRTPTFEPREVFVNPFLELLHSWRAPIDTPSALS